MSLRPAFLALMGSSTLFLGFSAHAATLTPGDLVKASGPSVYYYAQDGKRYVFPTDKTYFTWYTDFSTVKTITDAELGALMIGGNVTYRPGVKLVKITTDPKVYAIGPGKQLRWIKTEALAIELYGSDWAKKVDDIPDPFFVNYAVGSDIASSTDYTPSAIKDAHATIQAILSATSSQSTPPSSSPPPASEPPSAPPPTGGATSTEFALSIMASKPTARPGDMETFTVTASHPSGITKVEIFFDGQLVTSCLFSPCTVETQVPISGTKSSYEARAYAWAVNNASSTKAITIPIDSSANGLVKLTVERPIIRQGQTGGVVIDIDSSIAILRTDIYRDGVSIKACASGIRQCRWSDTLSGIVGTAYEFYGQVTDTIGRLYKTAKKTITIGTNDSPLITTSAGKPSILKGESVDVTVSASDDDGITKIEILKDGAVLKTCQGATPCTVVTGPWMNAETLKFSGRATDGLGFSATGDTIEVVVQ